MKLQKLILIALFLGIGTVLHAVVPGILFGMKPDLMLLMMFLAIYLFADKKNVLVIGIVAGILNGLTTTMPGGFIPLVIDKIVTTLVVFALFFAFKQIVNNYVLGVILSGLGTLLSGAVFLSALTILGSLPGQGSFLGMYLGMVVPTAVVNTLLMAVLYPIVKKIMNRSSLSAQTSARHSIR
ncbi:tryptophan transporter [Terrilactibacillus sp. S3-3]|nr:tryptophan transporter [Terrilactibacillus sp. S3-3]